MCDLLDRRRLIGQSLLSVVALFKVAAAPTGTELLAAMGAVGGPAVVIQVMVAYAAGAADAAGEVHTAVAHTGHDAA